MSEQLLIATCAMLALMVITAAALKGWEGWLAFKRSELALRGGAGNSGASEGAARIEIADLKERIRKLEAIASGVDL